MRKRRSRKAIGSPPSPSSRWTPATAHRGSATSVRGVLSLPVDLAALSAVLVVPVEGVLRAQLRDTYDEVRGSRLHEAMDILVPRGTPVLSATDGRVLKLFDSKPGGLMVYATDASERFILLYGHLDGYAEGLSDGAPLARGRYRDVGPRQCAPGHTAPPLRDPGRARGRLVGGVTGESVHAPRGDAEVARGKIARDPVVILQSSAQSSPSSAMWMRSPRPTSLVFDGRASRPYPAIAG